MSEKSSNVVNIGEKKCPAHNTLRGNTAIGDGPFAHSPAHDGGREASDNDSRPRQHQRLSFVLVTVALMSAVFLVALDINILGKESGRPQMSIQQSEDSLTHPLLSLQLLPSPKSLPTLTAWTMSRGTGPPTP
jgi:hypothetical protein